MSKPKVSFLLVDSTTDTSKSYSLQNNQIKKKASAQMYEAKATLMNCSLNRVASIIDAATSKQVLIYGLPESNYFDDDYQVHISTPKRKKISVDDSIIHRNKQCLKYRKTPSIMMCDYDPSPYGPTMTVTEVLNAINDVINITNIGFIVSHSVSSQVHIKGKIKKHGGRHILIGVKDGRLIKTETNKTIKFNKGQTLFDRLYLNGHGYIALSACGSFLVRTCIDVSVFSGERIDFVGAPVSVSDDLMYKKVKAKVHEGELLDLSLIDELSDQERLRLNKMIESDKQRLKQKANEVKEEWTAKQEHKLVAKGLSKEDAKKAIQLLENSEFKVLPHEFELTFNQLGVVTVSDVMNNPKKYHDQELADPIEGPDYGSTTAKYYYNERDDHKIHSFAHGSQNYTFKQEIGIGSLITYKERIVNHTDNIRYILNKYNIVCRRNLLTHENEFTINKKFGKEGKRNAQHVYIRDLCSGNGIPVSDLKDSINYLCSENEYHPVVDYIDSLTWDNTNHLRLLFETLTLKYEDKTGIYWAMFKRWFIQCIAALYEPTFASHGVLVFVSEEGLGKTTWLERLCKVSHSIGTGISVDTSNKDHVALFMSYWIVELGEISSTFKKSDIEDLKRFITLKVDSFRPPYGHGIEEFDRRTVMSGTVNDEKYLVSDQQNRRFFTIPIVALDCFHDVDMNQVWAQCKVMYDNKEKWWFDKDELQALKEHNRQFRMECPVTDALDHAGVCDPRKEDVVAQDLNITGIFEAIHYYVKSRKDLSICKQYLEEKGLKYNNKTRKWLVGFKIHN